MKQSSTLNIEGLELMVHLGVDEIERQTPQPVVIELSIHFREPPMACHSDRVEDTADYRTICEAIGKALTAKQFKTIEHMAQETFVTVTKVLAARFAGELELLIKKPNVALPGLTKGSSFRIKAPL